jgi:hypothetical protein
LGYQAYKLFDKICSTVVHYFVQIRHQVFGQKLSGIISTEIICLDQWTILSTSQQSVYILLTQGVTVVILALLVTMKRNQHKLSKESIKNN